MKGSQAIVACLLANGVDTIFGYPGGMNLPLYDALYDEKRLKHILTTHEQNAAFAADGYARATGKIGVCTATSGPGATNLVTGIADAFLDSVPLLALTGQVDTASLGRDAFQETDILDITIPITKHNFMIKHPQDLLPSLEKALVIAQEGRPGPVLIDIPRDMFFAEVDYKPAPVRVQESLVPDAAFMDCLQQASEMIAQAKKPLIMAGGGVINAGASAELLAFAEKFNLPVANTLMGIGAFPIEHKQALGFTGLHGLGAGNNAVAEADLIIAVGSRFGDRQTGSISEYTVNNRKFIQIDIDPAEINKNVTTNIGLAGDMKTILMLLTRKEPVQDLSKWWQRIRSWQQEFRYAYNDQQLNVPWLMHHVAEATQGGNYAFATDVGQHQMWAAQHLRVSTPRTWFSSGGLGSMGFGLPAAMGAQLAFGDSRRLIHFAGDGGIKMTGNEYYTIASLGLPIISIIINNHSLGMIRQLQKVFYQGRYSSSRLPDDMDFVQYVNCFGIPGENVRTPQEFAAAFKKACSGAGPFVIVADVADAFVEPMVKAGGQLNEFVQFGKNNV